MGSYGRNYEFRRSSRSGGPSYSTTSNDPRETRLIELIAEALDDLGPQETPLSRVTVNHRGAAGNEYIIRDAAGAIVGVLEESDLDTGDGTAAEALRKAVNRVVCTDCGAQLIDGESGLCGPCEGKAVKDLLGMWSDDA